MVSPSPKEEMQRGKDAAINESKMFLSKRVAELEKTNNELERHDKTTQNRLNLALSEKEQLKQQINQLKTQLKITNEMSSDITLRSHIHAQYGIGYNQAPSQQIVGGGPSQPRKGAASLAERRENMKQLKNAKRDPHNFKGHEIQEPRVFEVEDDDNEDVEDLEQENSEEHIQTLDLN